jgi:hypothetical protein
MKSFEIDTRQFIVEFMLQFVDQHLLGVADAPLLMESTIDSSMTKKINDLEKQLGPDYLALFDALNNADQNSKYFQDILSMFDTLDGSCSH